MHFRASKALQRTRAFWWCTTPRRHQSSLCHNYLPTFGRTHCPLMGTACSLQRRRDETLDKDVSHRTIFSNSSLLVTRSTSRSFSSLSSVDKQDEDIVLYTRSSNRFVFPRAVLAFATLHSAYWVWYVTDFIPAINSAPLEYVHISPSVGYVGMAVAATINFFAAKYPKSLVSKLSLGSKSGIVKLWVHNLPWVTLSSKPIEYNLGDIYMDPTAHETKSILHDYDGKVELFRGIIVVYAKRKRVPLLLEVREDSEAIQNPEIFMQAMFDPDRLTAKRPRSSQKRYRNNGKQSRRRR